MIFYFGHKKSMLTIWHNNRCSKSRDSLCLIQENHKDVTIFEYLKNPPTSSQIREVLKKLHISAFELVRKGEEIYKTEFKNKNFSEEEWISILTQHPVLIERPIVIKGDKAVIGRPIDKVKELLG